MRKYQIINIVVLFVLFFLHMIVSAEDLTVIAEKTKNIKPMNISADSLKILIPELSWPDSNRTRMKITPEIALQYPVRKLNPKKIRNNAWGVGENLKFEVNYSFYKAGTATMSVPKKEFVNGGICYNIVTKAESNDFISKFYKVSDIVNSYIDVNGLFSRRFEKKLREGNYKSDHFVDFYPSRGIALNTKKKYSITEIPAEIQDILSSLYILRTYNLNPGVDESIDVYADGKVYPLKIKVYGFENVTVPAGKFRCIKVEPVLKSEGIFSQKGRLLIWLTADTIKMPVKMESKILIGKIVSELQSFTLAN